MTEAIASSSKVAASPARGHRRKKTAEKWDDDFEFALSTKSKAPARRPSIPRQEDGRPLSAASLNGRRSSSPVENWGDEEWDDCGAGPSRSPPRSKRAPPPLNIPAAKGQPPRMSSSHSLSLRSPSSESRSPHTGSISTDKPPITPQTSAQPRSRPTSAMSASSRSKLVKRHPSTSFAPSQSMDPKDNVSPALSTESLGSPQSFRPSSKQAVRSSKSREQMPPPPMPVLLGRSSSIKHSKERAKDSIRESSLPFSPSSEQIEAAEAKKPGFWKRLSAAQPPSSSKGELFLPKLLSAGLARSPSDRRRNRASSTGGHIPSDPSLHPPLPPYPQNLRSTSSTSASSSQSAESAASDRSGPVGAISSMLRRSSSRLSAQQSPSAPPSSFPYAAYSETASKSSINMPIPESAPIIIPAPSDPPPSLSSSSSFSRGFHLPSPSPKSPYNIASVGLGRPSLPHSNSFPEKLAEKQKKGSGSDTETEADGSVKTPKRRKKIRPVSALPAPRRDSGWPGEGWKGFAVSPIAPALPSARAISDPSSGADVPSTPNTVPMPSTSTFKKIATLSKQHGRRLSGAWKFGTNGSPSSADSPNGGSRLETVLGSPSKPDPAKRTSPISRTRRVVDQEEDHDDEFRDTFRAGSVSAPGSRLQSEARSHAPMPSHISESAVNEAAKADKQRRRQSWNDFVIPRGVLEKQKELKQGIGAVKQFATGVECEFQLISKSEGLLTEALKSLLDSHALVQSRIFQSGADDEISLYTTLERDFAQYWEMATVLIEVGSTGQGTVDSSAAPRSRRVTLAAEEAKAASDSMRRAFSNMNPVGVDEYTPKKGSLPEPGTFGLGGLPHADHTQWRASTGRQDLSKRQLEVLRTMLRTPISDSDRSGTSVRQASTLSASSTQSHIVKLGVNHGRSLPLSNATPNDTPESKISLPSPGDSTYIVPSGSFPSPTTASVAYPQAKRRSSRAGLAGLKDFLRGLRTQKSSGNLTSTAAESDVPPVPRTMPPTPISPTTSFTAPTSREEVFYPTQRHTMAAAALGPATRRGPSPEKKGAVRPSIRNIFRTSSGNWSELVKGDGGPRRSSEQDRTPSAASSQEHFGEPPSAGPRGHRPAPLVAEGAKMKATGILRRPSVEQFHKTGPTTNVAEKGNTTPRSPRWGRKARPSVSIPGEAPPSPTKDERTVRPSRKSRMKGLGLGWPEDGLPNLDNPADRGSPPASPRKASAGTIGSMGTFASSHSLASGLSGASTESLRRGSEAEAEDRERERDMPTLALTPDNLPVLLEYLRQCEAKLKEWRERAEGLLGQ